MIFYTLKEVQNLIGHWRQEYNPIRPLNALGYKPTAPDPYRGFAEILAEHTSARISGLT